MDTVGVSFLVLFITLVPYIIFNYNEIKFNKITTILWSIFTFFISFIVMLVTKTHDYIIPLLVSLLSATIFNYAIVNKTLDIKKVPKSGFVFALFFLSVLFQFIPVLLFDYDLDNLSQFEQLVLTTFSDSMSLIILVILYFRDLKEDFKKIKGNFYKMMDTGIKYWVVGIVIMLVTNTIIALLFSGANATNEQRVQELIKASSILSVITIGLIAPCVEELTFRKAFRDLIKNDKVFILASGIVFGALHVVLNIKSAYDLLYIIPYSSLGIAFALMYKKTNNIYTSIFIHVAHNTVLTLISVLGVGLILW